MDILKVNSDEFKNILMSCFSGGGLIPVIGAGFSRGSEARNGKVPDGKALMEMMLKSLDKAGVINKDKLDKIKKQILNQYLDII